MGTMLTAEEYKELNELRRYKAERELEDAKIKDATERIEKVTQAMRDMIEEGKRSRMPNGGAK